MGEPPSSPGLALRTAMSALLQVHVPWSDARDDRTVGIGEPYHPFFLLNRDRSQAIPGADGVGQCHQRAGMCDMACRTEPAAVPF